MEKKKFQFPHTYIIIFGVVLLAAILTMFVPQGRFETTEVSYMIDGVEKTRTVVDPSSFEYVLDENGNKVTAVAPLFGTEDFGGQGILNFVFEGLTTGDKWGSAIGIIAFILVVGGAFGIVMRTGAIDAGILRIIQVLNGKEIMLIPILITIFSLGGAVFGMGEEALPFVMILVPMFIAMGYDAVVGVMCSYVATQIGFGSSWQNPFGLAIAQGIAGVPVMSGAWFRIPMWIFFTLIAIIFTTRYAKKIKKNPQLSVAYESDKAFREEFKEKGQQEIPFTLGHKLVLLTIVATMVWTVWGVIAKGYYIPEIASQFFVMGLVAGIIGVKREWSRPFWVRFKKHYCPTCMNLLTTTKVSKIVNSNSEEAKDYDFSSGDTYMIGNIKFIWTEFLCAACGKTYSLQEIRENEKKTK